MNQNQQPDFNEQNSQEPKKRSLFGKGNQNLSEKDVLFRKYTTSRQNLLLLIILTVVNIVLLLANADYYLLFSASAPYVIAALGMALKAETASVTLLIVCTVVATILLVPYILCYIFSKKHVGWLIAALVYFIIDTLVMLLFMDLSMIVDVLFHAWAIFDLIVGIKSYKKLQGLEAAEAEIPPVDSFQKDGILQDETAQDETAYFFTENQ